MDTLIGVSAGVISLLLGVLGVAVSLSPPATRRGKGSVVVAFAALSLLAMMTTVADRRAADEATQQAKARMDELLSSSAKLTEQNHELLLANNTLQQHLPGHPS